MVNVNQKSPNLQERPEQLGQRNMFDMCHDHKTTMTMGKIYPFLTLPTLPDDTWYIKGEFMFRFAPLYLPIMHRVNLTVDYFYVSNRILWPGRENAWESWINPATGNGANPAPYIVTQYTGLTSFSLLIEYMGFPTNLTAETGNLLINAFPLSAYLCIYDEYYRNDQVQSTTWFPLIGGDNTAFFEDAWQEKTGTPVMVPFRRNWNRDNFTAGTPTPSIGNDVLIPVQKDWSDDFPGIDQIWRLKSTGAAAVSVDVITDTAGESIAGAGGPEMYLDIQDMAGTIRQLRYAEELTVFLEQAMRAGDKYVDFLRRFWKRDIDPLNIDRPKWIGGKKGKVVVSEVLSTAQTIDASDTITSYVGSYAGQAMVLDNTGKPLEFTSYEHGWIIGLVTVYPQSSYFQGLTSWWENWVTPQQYPWEHFALIGDEPVLNKQVAYNYGASQYDDDTNNGVFNYRPKYSDWRHVNDVYSGLMRSTFLSFHMGRLFDETTIASIAFNDEFITCTPDVTRVFQVGVGEDEIYAHIYNDVMVQRRLPKWGIPVK